MAYDGTTAAILSNYSEVLKNLYLPAVREQLNNDIPVSNLFYSNEEDVSGKNATINCHYGRSNAIFARPDGGALGDADYQKHKTTVIPMKYNYGRITFSGPTIRATRDERGAYARVIDNEVVGMVTDMKKDINRQLWGCGYGILARWRTTASGTSYTLQKKYRGNSAGGDGFGSAFGAKYLKEFTSAVPVVLTLSSGTTAATVDATNIAVSAWTESTDYDTITCTDPSVTEAASTFYVRPGNMASLTSASAAGAGRYEMMGLRGIVDEDRLDKIAFTDGASNVGFAAASAPAADSLQGLSESTYPWWKSIVDKHESGRYKGQRNLTLTMFQKMFDKVEAAAGMGVGPDVILTTQALRREYIDLCKADRITVNEMALDGGQTTISYNGVPFMVDLDAIDGEIYYLTTQYINIYRMSDFEWMDLEGSIFSKVSGYDAYEAVLFRYAEMGCSRRNVQGVLCDLYYEA